MGLSNLSTPGSEAEGSWFFKKASDRKFLSKTKNETRKTEVTDILDVSVFQDGAIINGRVEYNMHKTVGSTDLPT